jgi:hypothetical protein
MTAFYIAGGLLAFWAVLVSFLGITREGFPKTDGSARIVMAISILLTLGAILSGVIGGALHEEDEGHETEAAVLLTR